MPSPRFWSWLIFVGLSGMSCAARAAPIPIAEIPRTTPVNFEQEVLPILRQKCLACHSASEKQGDLVLESAAQMQKGGDSGPAIVPGKSNESLLLKLASHRQEPFMPPPKNDVAAANLTAEELGLLRLWIDQGAAGGAGGGPLSPRSLRPLPKGVNAILATAITSDGQYAACSRANQIDIYHVPSGQLVTRLSDPSLAAGVAPGSPAPMAHRDLIQSLAFNNEGDLLASGSFREVKLWRRPRDVRAFSLAAQTPVTAVAVSPDQTLLATAAAQHTIRLWNAAQGQDAGTLSGHTGAITGLRFTPDGKHLISASADQTLRVWNVAEKQLVGRIDTASPVQAVELVMTAAAGPLQMASAGTDNFIRLWQVPDRLAQPLANAPPKPLRQAVSPDQKLIAIGATDGTVRVLDRDSGNLVKAWTAHEGAVPAVAFAPVTNGPKQLATIGADGHLRTWNAETGERLANIQGAPGALEALAFSADAKRVVVGATDGKVTVWNVATEPQRDFAAAELVALPTAFAMSLDGKRAAFGGTVRDKPGIVVRNLDDGSLQHVLLGHEGPVLDLAFSPDGNRLVSGSADKTARVWNLAVTPAVELIKFAEHAGPVTAVALNSDGSQGLSGAADNSLKTWTVADGKLVRDFPGHAGPIADVAWGAGNQPVSASADATVRFWNVGNGQPERAISEAAPLVRLVMSRDGAKLAVALTNHSVKLYQANNSQLLQTLVGHAQSITALSFSGEGSRLLSTSTDGKAIAWEVMTGRLLETALLPQLTQGSYGVEADRIVLAHGNGAIQVSRLHFGVFLPGVTQAVTGLAVHPSAPLIFVASADGNLRGFNANDGSQAFVTNHGSAVRDLALSPNAQFLATAGDNQQIRLWTPGNGAPAQPPQLVGFSGPVRAVTFSPDSLRVLGSSAGEPREILVFSLPEGIAEERLIGHAAPAVSLSAIAVTEPNNRLTTRVLSVGDDAARLWELRSVKRLIGHTQPVTSLAALPRTPGQLVSGSLDGTLRRWNLDNGQPLQQFNHGGPITSVGVRPDGERFVSTSNNFTAKLWNAQNGQQLAEIRGDIRLKAQVARLTQQQTAATARQVSAKQAAEAAEKDVPVKTDAEKKAADALAAATKSVTEKQAALKVVTDAKTAAEKVAVEAAAAAQKAAIAKLDAERLAKEAMVAAQRAALRATQLAQLAQSDPKNQEMQQASAQAQQGSQQAATAAQTAAAAVAAPTQAAATAAQAAQAAAQRAAETQKPYNDSLTATKQAEAVQNTAAQIHAAALRELQMSQAALPIAKQSLAAADMAVQTGQQQLMTATQQATASELPLRAAVFSPDGRHVATAGDFPAIHAWDSETGAPIASYAGHTGPILALNYISADRLISGSADQSAGIWESNPGWVLERTLGRVEDPAILVDRIMAIDFSDDGSQLATGGGIPSRGGEIKIFRVADGSLVRAITPNHDDAVFSVAFSPDGRRLASGGADKYLRTFDLADGHQLRRYEGHTNYVLSTAWKGDGQILASSSADRTVKIWQADTGDQLRTIEGFGKHVTAVRFIGETENIVTACGDKLIRMYNALNGGLFLQLGGAESYLHCVDITPGRQFVVSGGQDSVLRIWDGNNSQLLRTLPAPGK